MWLYQEIVILGREAWRHENRTGTSPGMNRESCFRNGSWSFIIFTIRQLAHDATTYGNCTGAHWAALQHQFITWEIACRSPKNKFRRPTWSHLTNGLGHGAFSTYVALQAGRSSLCLSTLKTYVVRTASPWVHKVRIQDEMKGTVSIIKIRRGCPVRAKLPHQERKVSTIPDCLEPWTTRSAVNRKEKNTVPLSP